MSDKFCHDKFVSIFLLGGDMETADETRRGNDEAIFILSPFLDSTV